jgi:transcriptional regulator with XRE-family HTH domain
MNEVENMSPTRLRNTRKALGYSQQQVIRRLAQLAQRFDLVIASPSALQTMLSRWENGHDQVTSPDYQRLFREIYGRTNTELGFQDNPEDLSIDELRDRIHVARTVDTETIDIFREQINAARRNDRKTGSALVLQQMNAMIEQVQALLSFGVTIGHREQLGAILADAATLAGWKALDRSAISDAWKLHEIAKSGAREANSPSLLAHAAAQQAVILIDVDENADAVELIEYALSVSGTHAPPLLRAWLNTAYGEGLAANGQRDESLRAFDKADNLLITEPIDEPQLPFLLLNKANLTRWRGNALTTLGDHEAINQLESALSELNGSSHGSARGKANLLVDLAVAHGAAGNTQDAREYAAQARKLITQIGSDRHRRRLSRIQLLC